MAKKKSFSDHINDLHPSKLKVWVTPKTRREAARALGRSRRKEAIEPLIRALDDPEVADSAVQALAEMPPMPATNIKEAVRGLMAYAKRREDDFIKEFFCQETNPEVMALCPEQKGHPILEEPHSYLAAAISMVKQLEPQMAAEIETALGRGLDPYSRQKFRANVRLLNAHEVFLTWPELEELDRNIELAHSLISSLTGEKIQAHKVVPQKSGTDLGPVDPAELAEFVRAGLERKAFLTVSISEVPHAVYAVARQIMADHSHVDRSQAARMAQEALALECLHCGPIQKPYVKKYLQAAAEAFDRETPLEEAVFDRSNAGPLSMGRCPDCDDKPVRMALDKAWIAVPDKRPAPKKQGVDSAPGPGKKFHVVLSGEVLEGKEPKEVADRFASLFKIAPEKAQKLFQEKKPRIIKKELERDQASKYVQTLKKIGAQARMVDAD